MYCQQQAAKTDLYDVGDRRFVSSIRVLSKTAKNSSFWDFSRTPGNFRENQKVVQNRVISRVFKLFYFPLKGAIFQIGGFTRNQFDGNVTWVRIPPCPPEEPPWKHSVSKGVLLSYRLSEIGRVAPMVATANGAAAV
ncbi:hypothetical protein KL86CLO1_11326 [uncultured Eubacteriales bacterium]|uniref:Uncharacterized protein n=1 Tax=uncultured Eubacteriales bacterium TaxID=172733 RepID=A0A212JLN1_9FIRM|nr:hypothetical protein KL86CLO1_11326 [uncultured Eubacteriales bacterium]